MTSFMIAANMIEQQQQAMKKWSVVKMASALKKGMMGKTAVKKMKQLKWIAVKTANAQKKDMTAKTAAKMRKIINNNFSNSLI